MNLDNMTASATLSNGRAQASLTGHNEIFDGNVAANILLSTKKIEGAVSANLKKADLFRMRLVDKQLTIGTYGNLDINTDMKQTHYVSGRLNELYVKEEKKVYNPGDVGILLKSRYHRCQGTEWRLHPEARCEGRLRTGAQAGECVIRLYHSPV